MTVQGLPRSLILAPMESAYATSYLSSIVNLVLSCPVSEILQVCVCTRILGVFPLDYFAVDVSPRSEVPKLIIRCNYSVLSNLPNTYAHGTSTSRTGGQNELL